MRKTHRRTQRFAALAAVPAALAAAALLLPVLPAPPALADDRSLVKESESEPYVMIMLDITGSMNRVPGGSNPPYATLCQDDPGSKMFQAKEALYQVLGDPKLENVHFGFAVFPNQEDLRINDKDCNPDLSGNNGLCICELDAGVANNGCSGWEPNSGDDDTYRGFNFKFQTVANPNDASYPAALHYGDVIPMDWDSLADKAAGWTSDNRRLIQRRLAPNLNLDGDGDGIPAWNDPNDPQATPDFRVNRYFSTSTTSTGGDNIYTLLNSAARPLVARGSTPLARALRDFNAHFALWQPQAVANDPKFGCKQVHVIFITDGLDTCESSSGTPSPRETEPPNAAAEVFNNGLGPQVWAVGYSLSGIGEGVLNEIARRGGTNACPVVNDCNPTDPTCCPADAGTPGDPSDDPDHAFFPTTQSELANAIADILDSIRSDARSFAAAAVPQGQANVSDKIYLANFFPLEDLPLWPGTLDAYLRPLPLKTITLPLPDGTTEDREVPDRGATCPGTANDTSCRLWDAGDQLLLQGATDTQLDALDYNLGQGATQRRAFYSVEATTPGTVPAVRKPFVPSSLPDADAEALIDLMGCGRVGSPFTDCAASPPLTADLDVLHDVVRWVHETKSYTVPVPDPDPDDVFGSGSQKPYLLGEIFHSDPVVIGSPENFRFYAVDLFADRPTKALFSQGLDAACGDQGDGANPGYVCFFEKHRFRRKLVLVGSNDGQLHAFDAGRFIGNFDNTTGVVTGRYNNGTGREVFSFVPRGVMPTLVEQSRGAIELYGVDGKVQASDVRIDVGAGLEWRTVVVGTLREGGPGVFALDVTQPDELPNLAAGDNRPQPQGASSTYVPSCTDGGADCGTLPFPSALWEFYDLCAGVPCDEDVNSLPDLADGWSRPAIGVVEVCRLNGSDCGPGGADVEKKFVAVFGGGFDPEHPLDAGNHLYIVDLGTGKPIYKRLVEGAVPSEPAAVDTDQDGLLDTIYVGTTAGLMYKVSLRGRPPLVDVTGVGTRVISTEWDPFPIFDVGGNRPIFYPPSVIFVADKGRFALAFGTGYREHLWQTVNQTARFVVLLDEIVDSSVDPPQVRPFQLSDAQGGSPLLPLDPADLQSVDPESTVLSTANFLTTPQGNLQPGWWMELQTEERVIAAPFALSGLLVFLTFQPDEVIGGGGRTCANAGLGRSFTVFSTSGSTIINNRQAYTIIPDLPTSPYTEVGVTKNPNPSEGESEEGLPPELEPVLNALKTLFPKECRFGNYTINVKTRRADTGIEFIAPVPICIVQKNWKGL